jgi:hypothetical protein
MDATTLVYGTATALGTLLAAWIVTADWQHQRWVRRRVQMRLRQLQRTDAGFARGRA